MNPRMVEIEARKAEIRAELEKNDPKTDLEALDTELRSLDTEKQQIEKREQMIAGLNVGTIKGNMIPNPLAPTEEKRTGIDAIFAMPVATPEQQAEMRNKLFSAPEYRTGFFKVLAGRNDLDEVEKRALTTAANSGGAAVPTTTYDMIIKRMQQTSVLFGLIQQTNLPGNVTLPVANAQNAAKWSDTAPDPDEDDTLTQVSLAAYALSKFAKIKGQLILMAIDALETYIVSAISDQLAIAVENAILNGTGPDHSQPTGILSGVTWDSTNSLTYSSSIGYDNLVDAEALLDLYTPGAVWIMNSKMKAQFYKIKTSTAQPLFMQNPITGVISDPLGYPLMKDNYMPDDTILLMNPKYYFMNINQNPTITADDSAGFLSTSRVYRGTMFLDAKPALNAAFVKLTKAS